MLKEKLDRAITGISMALSRQAGKLSMGHKLGVFSQYGRTLLIINES